ncbi:MAG TPA: preprotein translocase subunit SecG [Acholeplasmataceae bacterium]|jgi:preprotein translocase subunit SecG|nr:preprotein translocase subunit SecG [Acholeplasmataceae bacterium]
MEDIMIWVDFIALIAVILLIGAVMLQQSSDDISSAFSGEKSELFKERKTRGLELFLTRGTIILTVIVVVSVLLSNNLR